MDKNEEMVKEQLGGKDRSLEGPGATCANGNNDEQKQTHNIRKSLGNR